MIKYALLCHACEAEFEGWFASSARYDEQQEAGQIDCPVCSSAKVHKAIMAPSVRGAIDQEPIDPKALMQAYVSKARRDIAENYDYVGDQFATEARAMFYGDKEERAIWGEATLEEAIKLEDEGIETAEISEPLAPETPKDKSDLN